MINSLLSHIYGWMTEKGEWMEGIEPSSPVQAEERRWGMPKENILPGVLVDLPH